jgi:hypothetical protein
MKVLKVLAIALLGLLLFLCLSMMGVAVTVNATTLNSGFITKQIDKLDVVAIFNEEILTELHKQEKLAAHPEVITSIQNAVTHNSPAVKSAVNKAISNVYTYLLHGGTLNLRNILRTSVLDPQLPISILNDVDLNIYIRDLLLENLPMESASIAGIDVDLTPYADNIVVVIQPWFKEQLTLLLPGLYDYVLDDNSNLALKIPTGSILANIGATLKSGIMASPPPSLANLSQAKLSLALDIFWSQTVPRIPETIDLSSSEIGLEPPTEVGQGLDNAQHGLIEARRGIAIYQESFRGLVAFTILLLLLVILINRDIKAFCRILGGIFVTYGITEAIGVIISRALIHNQLLSLSEMPGSIQLWLVQFVDNLTNPLLIFSIFCVAIGVTFFVASYLYSHRQERPANA